MARGLPHLLTVLVAALGTLVWWQSTQGFQAFTWESYRRLKVEHQPVRVMNLQLQDHRHRNLDLNSFQGKILVINFIYTRCPTICGVIGARYAELQTAFTQLGYTGKVVLLSISLEPQVDTPDRLQGYLRRFSQEQNDTWLVVRPAEADHGQALLQQLGVVSIPDGFGGITHNAAMHIVDQHGRLVKIIDEDKTELTLAAVQRLLNKMNVERADVI